MISHKTSCKLTDNKEIIRGLGRGSVAECLSDMYKELSSIPLTTKQQQKQTQNLL